MATLEEERISTLADPLPLPPFEGDPNVSEDENLLIWVSILARHSSSKKGHMGTIFVRPPQRGNVTEGGSVCEPALSSRVAAYANNTPLLFSRNPKGVPEIHAEALAISRSAAKGISLAGCTVYISFPPCNECFKLLLAAGIKRCVFKKGIPVGEGNADAVMVAAEVHGVQMVGTLDRVNMCKQAADKEGEQEGRARERKREDERDAAVRAFWASQGEDASKTRGRVNRWWVDWTQRYRAAERTLHARWGVKKKRADAAMDARREADLDGLTNKTPPVSTVPHKRPSEEADTTSHKDAKVEEE